MAFFSTRNIDFPYQSNNLTTDTTGTITKTSANDLAWSGNLNVIFNTLNSSGTSTSPGTWNSAGCAIKVEALFYTEAGSHFSTQTLINKTIYNPNESYSSLYNRNRMYSWELIPPGASTNGSPPAEVLSMSYSEMKAYLQANGYTATGTGGFYVTEEPFGKRFLSDSSATVYSARTLATTPTWFPSIARSDSLSQNVAINFNAPEEAAYFRLRFTGINGASGSSTGSYTYPESAGMPTDEIFILDIPSVGYRKPAGSAWQNTALYYIKEPDKAWDDEADGFVKSGTWGKTKK